MKTIALLLLSLFCGSAVAHNIHYDKSASRKWLIAGENNIIEGSFCMFRDGKVYIENSNSQLENFPLSVFSATDQHFVLEKYERIKELNNTIHSASLEAERKSNPASKILILSAVLAIIAWFAFSFTGIKIPKYVLPVFSAGALAFTFSFRTKIIQPAQPATNPYSIDSAFVPFKPDVYTHWDATYFYVESIGIADHTMMAGITNWQQQVPLPQCYTGNNAWSIPLSPVIAATPVPVNAQHFSRGAIALAVNGVPIFNPYTNTGVDAFLDGQLDNFGGHSGRADDYHYHIAPLSLYSQTTATLPIAYALDGFAVYGSLEPDGSAMTTLDGNHGHYGTNGTYHYHGTSAAPYMIGKMVGQVTEDSTLQIVPQAAATPVRPAQNPLPGATITACVPNGSNNGYTLSYTLNSQNYSLDYDWTTGGVYTFDSISPGGTVTKTYNGNIPCVAPLSVKQTNKYSNAVEAFPNPCNGILNLRIAKEITEKDLSEIALYNSNGELIFKTKTFSKQMDLKNYPKGIYILRMQFPNYQLSKKIILE
jgi:hypothetical protein